MKTKYPFSETDFRIIMQNRDKQVLTDIKSRGNLLMRVDVNELSKNLANRFKFKAIIIEFDKVEKKIIENTINASNLPRGYDRVNSNVNIELGQYKIPFKDTDGLIKIKLKMALPPVYLYTYSNDYITIQITKYNILQGNDTSLRNVKRDYEEFIKVLKEAKYVTNEIIEKYNSTLEQRTKDAIIKEIEAIKRKDDSEDKL